MSRGGGGAPLLRSPPFPGVSVEVAAISRRRDVAEPALEDLDAIVAAVRAARVGGTFWAPSPDVGRSGLTLLRPVSAAACGAMLRDLPPGPVCMMLPAAPWSPRAARAAGGAGAEATIGDVDPWPLLDRATRVIAHGGDEWLLLAHVAGVAAAARSPGCFAPQAGETMRDVARRELIARVAYRDCFAGTSVTVAAAVAQLAEWRELIDRNRAIAVGAGIAWWKRREIARMLWVGRRRPFRFTRSAGVAVGIARAAGGGVAAWPSRMSPQLPAAAAAAGVSLSRVEDGFVRSAGLGSDLYPPCSIVVDAQGIYYDPERPSDLETILATTDFTPALIARAGSLAALIVREGIGKYGADPNARAAESRADEPRRGRRVLVAGQVQDDLSVRLGGAGITSNLELLRRARAASPGEELWFRPHPDVDAGHRPGAIADAVALQHADRVVRVGSMAALLDQVDRVHVLTSLTGFEALLRGCEVVVHGQPFYAGWGLTHDLAPPLPRRGRLLSLPMLVAGVLILYPRYLDPVTGLPTRPEVLMGRFAEGVRPNRTWLIRLRQAQGRLRLSFGNRAR